MNVIGRAAAICERFDWMDRRQMLAGLIALLATPAPAMAARRKSSSSTSRGPRRVRGGAYAGGGGNKNASYSNCSAARAAGAAPLHVGDGGYSRRLDRDGDGIACE
jgi:hypothetical protein